MTSEAGERFPSAPVATVPAKRLLIEGWRGINHSFALVNQSQILALSALGGLRLFHADLPFAMAHWNRLANAAGFTPDQQALIDALGAPADGPVDGIYRICAPFRSEDGDTAARRVTFMITELGLSTGSFAEGCDEAVFTRGDNAIVTGSHWARDRLLEWGFPAEKVGVISHGVDGSVFHPLHAAERSVMRERLGIPEDAVVFLNVGLPVWNKGIDRLLLAFARVRARGHRVRLILKDQKDLYGRSVLDLIRELGAEHPDLLRDETLGAISVLSINLSPADLRLLYGVANCYVSPYRAEGFNLPVLEAIACGTPAVVTGGGATDDFCHDGVAWRIGGTPGTIENAETRFVGRYIEPDLDDLIEAMTAFAQGRLSRFRDFASASQAVAGRFTWAAAARSLAEMTVDYEPAVT